MSNFRKFVSVSAVAILGVTNLLMPLSYVDAAKSWDSLTSGDLTNNPLQFIMPNKDVYLYAITEANHYFVDYYGNNHTSGNMPRSEFIYDQEGELSGNAFSKVGYTFSGWNTKANGGGTSYANRATVFNWTAEDQDVIDIYAQWNVNSYNIHYDLNDSAGTSSGVHSKTPASLSYDQTGTIAKPSRTGYSFSGWNITNMDSNPHIVGGQTSSAATADGVMGTSFKNLNATNGATVNFLATWTRNTNTKYKVEHYLETFVDDVYQTSPVYTDNLEGTTDVSVTPDVRHYLGFDDASTYSDNINADGSTVFEYKYPRKSFDLTLNAGRGIASVRGSGTVTAPASANAGQSTVISFKYDEPVTLSFTLKSGYTGGVWSGYSGAASAFNMPASNQEKTAYATPIVYNLTVNCVGGNNCTPNGTYTVESNSTTLKTPDRVHSEFAGWIGTNIVGTSGSVTIPSGSTGDRTYTATWTCHDGYHDTDVNGGSCQPNTNTEYKVRHYLQDLSGEYTILTGTVTQTGTTDAVTNARANTYVGFQLANIATGIIKGDKSTIVDITYDRLSYNGTVNSATGITSPAAVGDHPTTAGKYKYEDTVKLSATLQPGYTFAGWTVKDVGGNTVTVTNADSLTNASFKMPASAVTITPSTTINTYDITMILHNGIGTYAEHYTVETPTFSLATPTRDTGSVFEGWSGTDITSAPQPTVSITKGSVGDRTYEAIWSCRAGYHAVGDSCVANQYQGKVDYDDGEHGAPETISFTYDQVTNLPNPRQSGYDFVGWDITGMSGGVQHHIGTITVTGNTYSGATATGYMNLSTEQGMTDVTFTAIWSPRNDTPYVVYHYIKNVGSNTYTLSGEDHLVGTTDTPVTFTTKLKTFVGFTYNGGYLNGGTTRPAGAGLTTGNIEKDGSLKIYLYYDRNMHNVYLSGDTHVASLSWTGARSFEYGATVEVEATPKTGYHFKKWKRTTDATFATEITGS